MEAPPWSTGIQCGGQATGCAASASLLAAAAPVTRGMRAVQNRTAARFIWARLYYTVYRVLSASAGDRVVEQVRSRLKVGDRYGSVARVWRRIHRHVGGGNHSHQRICPSWQAVTYV